MSAGGLALLRQQMARRTPGAVRKLVRMGEHFARRQRDWALLLKAASGVSGSDRRTLATSALAAPLTALRALDGFGSPVLLRDVQVRVDKVGVFQLRRGTDDPIHILRWREPHMWAALEERLRPGDRFVDAGANIGFYALRASQLVGPGGSVVAIEMMPGTAESLRANVAATGADNVTVVEKALAAADGEMLEASADPSKLGQASIATASEGGRSLRLTVETARLDTLIPEGRVALMKMDLEGAEFGALQGAAGLLDRVDALIYESNGDDPRIEQLLRARGFTVRHLAAHDYIAVQDTSR